MERLLANKMSRAPLDGATPCCFTVDRSCGDHTGGAPSAMSLICDFLLKSGFTTKEKKISNQLTLTRHSLFVEQVN
jgi:hypothetical protein